MIVNHVSAYLYILTCLVAKSLLFLPNHVFLVHHASHILAKSFILHASTLIGLGSVTMISQPAIRQNTGNLIQAHLPSEQIVLY